MRKNVITTRVGKIENTWQFFLNLATPSKKIPLHCSQGRRMHSLQLGHLWASWKCRYTITHLLFVFFPTLFAEDGHGTDALALHSSSYQRLDFIADGGSKGHHGYLVVAAAAKQIEVTSCVVCLLMLCDENVFFSSFGGNWKDVMADVRCGPLRCFSNIRREMDDRRTNSSIP
jgi:hypothetical protein